MPIIVDKEKLAYAAGLFDGEGHSRFCLYNGKNRAIRLQVKMTDEEPLIKFFEAINYKAKIYGPYRERKWKGTYKDNYEILAQNFEEVQFILCMLWKWLSIPKRNQFKVTLTSYLNYRQGL